MIKNIPNFLSLTRIVLVLIILFLKPLSTLFFVIYFLAGLSDIFDGYIARKSNNESHFGATLDSIADFLLVVILLFRLIPIISIPAWAGAWIICIASIRGISLIIGAIRYKTIAFLHTIANKITGLLLFCFPLFYIWFGIEIITILLCGIASISAIEELIINITSKELKRDVKSIF